MLFPNVFYRAGPVLVRLNCRKFCDHVVAKDSHARPSSRTLKYHFLVCAIPMIGFGVMDNTIMIRAGDWIDNTVGGTLKLSTLTAAACGQALSDTCGVVFGGTIAAMAAKMGMRAAKLSEVQQDMRITRLAGTGGAAVGVFIGCCLGMTNLLFMDLTKRERLQKQKELKTIFRTVAKTSQDLVGVDRATIWMMSEDGVELWTPIGIDGSDRLVITLKMGNESDTDRRKHEGLAVACATSKTVINVEDVYKDERFNPSVDLQTGFRTQSVLCVPVLDISDEDEDFISTCVEDESNLGASLRNLIKDDTPEKIVKTVRKTSGPKVLGVVQLVNKHNWNNKFHDEDIKLAKMMAHHVAIFIKQAND